VAAWALHVCAHAASRTGVHRRVGRRVRSDGGRESAQFGRQGSFHALVMGTRQRGQSCGS
jgi:hypothetical protein